MERKRNRRRVAPLKDWSSEDTDASDSSDLPVEDCILVRHFWFSRPCFRAVLNRQVDVYVYPCLSIHDVHIEDFVTRFSYYIAAYVLRLKFLIKKKMSNPGAIFAP